MTASAGIERPLITLRRAAGAGDFGGDLGARAETGIDDAQHIEAVEGRLVIGKMLRLLAHLAVPIDAEPSEVFEDRFGEFGLAARPVDVLDAQKEFAAGLARRAPGDERRV